MSPDLKFTGGNILTVDESFRIEQAAAIAAVRFVAIGGDTEVIYNALGTTSVVETHGVAPEVTRLYRDLDDAERRLEQLVRLGAGRALAIRCCRDLQIRQHDRLERRHYDYGRRPN